MSDVKINYNEPGGNELGVWSNMTVDGEKIA
jgi:hypothetical protein